MKDSDWKTVLQIRTNGSTEEDIPVLKMALDDVSIRRLATAYLGMVKGDEVTVII